MLLSVDFSLWRKKKDMVRTDVVERVAFNKVPCELNKNVSGNLAALSGALALVPFAPH